MVADSEPGECEPFDDFFKQILVGGEGALELSFSTPWAAEGPVIWFPCC